MGSHKGQRAGTDSSKLSGCQDNMGVNVRGRYIGRNGPRHTDSHRNPFEDIPVNKGY